MKPIFDPEELTLMTSEEQDLNKKYVKMLSNYMDDKVDGVKMKAMTAGMANIVRTVQSRSATALLKFNLLNKGDQRVIADMRGRK